MDGLRGEVLALVVFCRKAEALWGIVSGFGCFEPTMAVAGLVLPALLRA